MRVLLISMPDSVSAFDNLVTFPNTGLCSIAGNLTDCDVRVLDLVACRHKITKTILKELNTFRPELVGLSAMTFQYNSAMKVARIVRDWNPEMPIVLGGYHGSLLYEEIGSSPEAGLFDFLIRGEGELSFSRLVQALGKGERDLANVPGLSFRKNGKFVHNRIGPLADLKTIQRPNRQARVYNDFIFFGLSFDCLETSRGCVMNCRFCSIREMYGRSFRKFPLERVLAEIDDLRLAGKKGVFFVDDNITLDVRWLRTLCEAIIAEGLNHIHYIMQASVDGLHGDLSLAKLLAKAGFRLVFLGIESGDQRTLETLKKGYSVSKTKAVVTALHDRGLVATGGFIVGNPDDRPEDIRRVFRFAGEIGLDHVILQCLTPYPKTDIRELLKKEGLITNLNNFEHYNGFIANVKTRYMSSLQLAREMVKAGVRYYNNPLWMLRSSLWRYARPSSLLHFFLVNLKFIYTGWRNRMFHSTHRF
jgi:radical SAM superfamily enzyme YgiQ (UPF0313 family)